LFFFKFVQVESSGGFYHGVVARAAPTPLADDEELERLLWQKSVEITNSNVDQKK
jgi:hypothetical protein